MGVHPATFLVVTQLERLLAISISLLLVRVLKKIKPAEIGRGKLLLISSPQRHEITPGPGMAGPAMLRIGGESAFVFVVMQAT